MHSRPAWEEKLISARNCVIGFLILLCTLVVPWMLKQVFPFQPTRHYGVQTLGRHFEPNDLRAAGMVACVLGAALLVLAGSKLQARQPSGSAFAFALAFAVGGVVSILVANALIPQPPTSLIY